MVVDRTTVMLEPVVIFTVIALVVGLGLGALLTVTIRQQQSSAASSESMLWQQALEPGRALQDSLALVATWLLRLPGVVAAELTIGEAKEHGERAKLASLVLGNPAALHGGSRYQVHTEQIDFAGQNLGACVIGARVDANLNLAQLKTLLKVGAVAIVNARYSAAAVSMKSLAEETAKERNGFVAALSHEIRGPLGIMMNAVELVADGLCGELTTDARDVLGMVRTNGNHLLGLVNDVLDYAKVEAGKLQPESTCFDIVALSQELVATITPQANKKKLQVDAKPLTSSVPSLFVKADMRHVRQILINMLTNAVKYTPDGGTITVIGTKSADKVTISVRDTGIGIAPEDRERVFKAFERVETGYAREQQGTGLGMPLARKLAELQGGTLDFESSPGQGSVFYVSLPEGNPAELGQVTDERDDPQGSGITVLYLSSPHDHDGGVGRRFLSSKGFAVQEVKELTDVVLTKATRSKTVLVCDVAKDVMQVMQQIRELCKPQARVFLITSRALPGETESFLQAGITRVLARPFPLRGFARAVREVASR